MKLPGPDHPITIEPFDGQVRVASNGSVLVDTRRALVLREASYPPVYYVPRDDVQLDRLARSSTHTHCPYKGDASYWSLPQTADVAWSYDEPYPAMAQIAGHLAFYPNRVTIQATSLGRD
jgi:uncharacterized protein (DUF427 family)